MSANEHLAAMLQEIADLMELTGADRFRVAAHSRAARIVDGLHEDVCELAKDRDALLAIDGIGPKIADKIVEYVEHERIDELNDLRKQVPPGLLDVLNIPGLGPKTVRVLWQELGVKSVADLKRVIADGSILQAPRMGEKTVENIKAALDFAAKGEKRTLLGEALPVALALVERLRKVKGVERADYAGSLRRGKETIGDIDVLVAAKDAAGASDFFRAMPEVERVLAAGETKSSVVLKTKRGPMQADLRVVPPQHYGAALLYFTGSKEHNVRLRERALKMGMTLNEYGLFLLDAPDDGGAKASKKKPTRKKASTRRAAAPSEGKPVASKTEGDIYAALKLPLVPPELREDDGSPLEHDVAHDFGLIDLADIKAELHAHTDASDGEMSIVELAKQSKARGFHTIAVTDHSKSQPIAGGLQPDRLLEHIEHVRAAAEHVKGITILAGSEVDILADGTLDYEDKVLEQLDIVVASPHSALKQAPDVATKRLLRAAEHPLVHILGHPTGRLIQRREGLSPDVKAIAKAAAKHRTALEINANYLRLDLRDHHVRAALEASDDTLIAIDCDEHRPADFDMLPYGVLTARRGGLTAARCVNAWPAKKLHAWLKEKR